MEQNVLTVTADRRPIVAEGSELFVSECPSGFFTRQLFLGETLDPDHIEADYSAGVLTLTIPVHQAAKPRKVEITSSDRDQAKQLSTAS